MACFGIDLAYVLNILCRFKFRSLGLVSKMVELENGSTIHCWVPEKSIHSSKPNLMLIHGFGGDGTLSWWNQIPSLVRDFALYIPDLLFFGQSYSANAQRSEIFQAQCLLHLLRNESVNQISLLGTSYGGFVAFHMAHLAPHLVTKVIISSSGICMDQASEAQLLVDSKCPHVSDLLIPNDPVKVKNAINFALHKPVRYIPHFLLSQLQQRFNLNRQEKLELLKGKTIGSRNCPPLPLLEQEILIIWGHGDRIFPIGQAYKLQRHLGFKSRLVVIPKTGHMPQIENPTEFNNHTLVFLKGAVCDLPSHANGLLMV